MPLPLLTTVPPFTLVGSKLLMLAAVSVLSTSTSLVKTLPVVTAASWNVVAVSGLATGASLTAVTIICICAAEVPPKPSEIA